MRLNQLIAKALNKPVEALTIDDVNEALLMEVFVDSSLDRGPTPAYVITEHDVNFEVPTLYLG